MEEKSLAMEFVNDYKKHNKRLFAINIIILVMWFATIGYLVYVLNDIGTEETTETTITQENDNGYNNYIGNDGDIINGKASN